MAVQKYEIPDDFLEAADRFVTLANEMGEQYSPDWVRAVLMYAAARYNAFNWVNRSLMREQTLEEAVLMFRTEYENMFRHNVQTMTPPPKP